nr:AAA family ATPase [Pseudoclavibacter sp. Marseille-Q3772]
MIRKIARLKDYRFFRDFKWDNDVPDLKRISLIYGSNGTGKTTLASLFSELRDRHNQHAYQSVDLEIEDDGTIFRTGNKWHDSFTRIHVLSDEYIEQNQSLDAAQTIGMPTILTIGKQAIDAENRLKTLRQDLTDVEKLLEKRRSDIDQQRDSITKQLRTISAQIVTTLARAGGRFQSKGSYSVLTARKRLESLDTNVATALDDAQLSLDIEVVNSDPGTMISVERCSLIEEIGLRSDINALLVKVPSVTILDTLQEHPEATRWVQEGQNLHQHSGPCIYCGGMLTEKRRLQIASHFSDAVGELQTALRLKRQELIQESDEVQATLASLPQAQLIAPAHRHEYEQALGALNTALEKRHEWRTAAETRISEKLENVLATPSVMTDEIPVVSFTNVFDVITRHNESVNAHHEQVQQAAKRVEEHILLSNFASYTSSRQTHDKLLKQAEDLKDRKTQISQSIQALEMREGDPLPSAEKLTREVARMLGRSELGFKLRNGRYDVTRNGEPVKHLSQGEKTAIIVVHFLESVSQLDPQGAKPIIIIDDPVSSLDNSVFMGVSTYIWSEVVSHDYVQQLILLTHNFELFRQWDIQIDALHKSKPLSQKFPATRLELKSEYSKGPDRSVRHPALSSWPEEQKLRRRLRSTYVHGFSSLVDAYQCLLTDTSLETKLEAQLLYPNVMRRVLETFLAFRRPDLAGDFNRSMRESIASLESEGADALRLHLTRFSHAHSHRDTPDSDDTLPPDEVQATLRACFSFMHLIDREHFSMLCDAIGADECLLLDLDSPTVEP